MTLDIKVSLSNWEKRLLDDAMQIFEDELGNRDPSPHLDTSRAFGNWAWSKHVKEAIYEVLADCSQLDSDEEQIPMPQVGIDRTWDILQDRLSARGETIGNARRCIVRRDRFVKENPDLKTFIKCAQNQPVEENRVRYRVGRSEADEKYWESIDKLYDFVTLGGMEEHPYREAEDGVQVAHLKDEEAMKTLLKMFEQAQVDHDPESLNNLPPGNEPDGCDSTAATNAEEDDMIQSEEEDWFSVSQEFEIYSLIKSVASKSRQLRRQTLQDARSFEEQRSAIITRSLSFLDCLEYIPASELCSPSDRPVDPGPKPLENVELCWRPGNGLRTCFLDHHLFTEESVLRHCVETPLELPGFRRHGDVMFIPRAVTMRWLSRRCRMLLYSDCAVTVDPDTRQPYLLETAPGKKYRQLASKFSRSAARRYFRAIIDRQRLNRSLELRNVLQQIPEADKALEEYEGIVDVIPECELEIEGRAKTGQNRNVYFARWRCPAKLGMAGEEELQVALKGVTSHEKLRARNLARELKNTFHAFAEDQVSSMWLLGIASLSQLNGDVFLVFKKASLLDVYLSHQLSGTPSDWDIIAKLFRDLAGSISAIHQKHQIHRDIGMHNVVMQELPCRRDPYQPTQVELVVIDLGESRGADDNGHESVDHYGDPTYWAPEVQSQFGMYNYESDMFAAGCLLREIVRTRCEIANCWSVPEPLGAVVSQCLSWSPQSRPTASDLEAHMDAVIHNHMVIEEGNWGCADFSKASTVEFDELTDQSGSTGAGSRGQFRLLDDSDDSFDIS